MLYCIRRKTARTIYYQDYANSLTKKYFCFVDPKNGVLDPKNLGKESKQHRNRAKFHLSCVQRFGNRFGSGKGAAPYKATFSHLFLNKNLSEKTQEFVPQVLKQVLNLSCLLLKSSCYWLIPFSSFHPKKLHLVSFVGCSLSMQFVWSWLLQINIEIEKKNAC